MSYDNEDMEIQRQCALEVLEMAAIAPPVAEAIPAQTTTNLFEIPITTANINNTTLWNIIHYYFATTQSPPIDYELAAIRTEVFITKLKEHCNEYNS